MERDDTDCPGARRLSTSALHGLAQEAIATVIRERAMRRLLWTERLMASPDAAKLCGRLADRDGSARASQCQFAEDCVEQEEVPSFCPINTGERDRHPD